MGGDAADPYFPLDWAPTAVSGHSTGGAGDGDSGQGGGHPGSIQRDRDDDDDGGLPLVVEGQWTTPWV